MAYRILDSARVIDTIDKLRLRVVERFPDSGLANVAATLAETARDCAGEAEKLRRPNMPIRLTVYAIWISGAAALAFIAAGIHYDGFELEAASLVQVLEPAMNLAVLMGIGVLALGRLEEQYKRRRALDYLHELRSIAHVIDMHQLTKDPYRRNIPSTAHSPKSAITGALLERYLDYCTEMLSLTGKLAALFAQSCRDTAVANGANDIEQLTTALARKIWQKMMAFGGRGEV